MNKKKKIFFFLVTMIVWFRLIELYHYSLDKVRGENKNNVRKIDIQ